jgi:hypothetical protein
LAYQVRRIIAGRSAEISGFIRDLTTNPFYRVHLIAWPVGQYRMELDEEMFQGE